MPEDKQVINSIVRSNLTNLITLNLCGNKTWWNDNEAQGYLCEFLQEQCVLKYLDLSFNYFSSKLTV